MSLFGPPNVDKLTEKKKVRGLVKALRYKDPAIRAAAAKALGTVVEDAEDAQTRGALQAAMEDESEVVREAVKATLKRLDWYEPSAADVAKAQELVAELRSEDKERIAAAVKAILEHVRTTVSGYGDFRPQDELGEEIQKILCPPAPRKPGVMYLRAPIIETDEFIAFMTLADTDNPHRHEFERALTRRTAPWKATILELARDLS